MPRSATVVEADRSGFPPLRGSLHFHHDTRFRAETNQVIERKPIHPVSRDLRDTPLRDIETASGLSLREHVAIEPLAQRLRQFASQRSMSIRQVFRVFF